MYEWLKEVKYRLQELELIKRAQLLKAGGGPIRPGDVRQRPINPYDQRGGGPMILPNPRQMQQAMRPKLYVPKRSKFQLEFNSI